jgi:hypothetical protein
MYAYGLGKFVSQEQYTDKDLGGNVDQKARGNVSDTSAK